ncbi:MAG: PfkB family carbohydrate kinase [Bacteroidaceae bacterium]|nr:PfkB family carbohydrate kinase [Bacteroidaceae bacterium]
MRKVIGIGESVLDIVFKNSQPQSANPGGSAFNAIIAVGRCGVPCCFLTEMGDDLVSGFTGEFMEKNGVDSSFVTHIPNSKSRISLAFLNEKNDAQYQFYRDPEPENLVYAMPDIQEEDLVLISSFYAVNPAIRYRVQPFLKMAKKKGAMIYYDVNFRPSHANSVQAVLPSVQENFSMATVVRGSIDDFKVLYEISDAGQIYQDIVAPYCKNLILTDGPNPVRIFTPTVEIEIAVPQIKTVSTIGAGDNFNAGVLCYLYKNAISKDRVSKLSSKEWENLQKFAQSFAIEVCQSIENYISPEFAKRVMK